MAFALSEAFSFTVCGVALPGFAGALLEPPPVIVVGRFTVVAAGGVVPLPVPPAVGPVGVVAGCPVAGATPPEFVVPVAALPDGVPLDTDVSEVAGRTGVVPLPVPPAVGPVGVSVGLPVAGATPPEFVVPVLELPAGVPLGGVGAVVVCAKLVAALMSATRAITNM